MKIINLKAENVKKIKAVDITPTDNTVVITGKNGQGKSSVLDSILYALGGKDALKNTPKPVREGEETASVELDLGDYIVKRTWNSSGTTRLEVVNKDGAKYGSPQSMLDEIVGRIAFDPLEFAQMKPQDQRAVLLEVLDLTEKVDELQAEYKEKYDERTIVGRQLKDAQGYLNTLKLPENAPEDPIDTVKVSNDLRAAEQHNREVEEAQGVIRQYDKEIEATELEIKELQADLAEMKKGKKEAEAKAKNLKTKDTTKLEEQLASADEMNRAYQTAQEFRTAAKKVKEYKDGQKSLSDELARILGRKEELITSAKLPIKGLNIDSDGVTYNEIPFTQLSSAEQLKVSLAIAMAMNPKLRVMRIMDGSLLDSDNMKVIGDMAKAEDYQVWIERVEDSGKVGILLEDGEVKK